MHSDLIAQAASRVRTAALDFIPVRALEAVARAQVQTGQLYQTAELSQAGSTVPSAPCIGHVAACRCRAARLGRCRPAHDSRRVWPSKTRQSAAAPTPQSDSRATSHVLWRPARCSSRSRRCLAGDSLWQRASRAGAVQSQPCGTRRSRLRARTAGNARTGRLHRRALRAGEVVRFSQEPRGRCALRSRPPRRRPLPRARL